MQDGSVMANQITITPLFSKRKKYSHEHEYRFVFKEGKIEGEKGNIVFEAAPCSVFHVTDSHDK